MKIGGGMSYIVGPMGSGKTLRAVRGICDALCRHEYVVTNVPLKDGWADLIARHASPLGSKAKRQKIADKLQRYYIFTEGLEDATLILTGATFPGAREGRVKWFWDESHNDLNNRTWQGRSVQDEERKVERAARIDLLEVTTQFRKLGIEGYLLSQHTDNTDAQVRRACNFVIKMQNQREQTRMLGMRVTPWPLFLAFWYPANVVLGKAEPLKVERYFLSWHRHLYDTMSLYHGLKGLEGERYEIPAEGLPHSVDDLLDILRSRQPETASVEAVSVEPDKALATLPSPSGTIPDYLRPSPRAGEGLSDGESRTPTVPVRSQTSETLPRRPLPA